jgi:glycolate oxidase FAD binding subunit
MRPGSEADLAELVRVANAPFVLRGGGTRGIGAVGPGEVLETGGLAGITLYEPGALTLVVQAGTPLAQVEAALAAEGQRLPFEPPDMRGLLGRAGESTIGGVVAANASGPRRVQAGACRDSMIGLRFVDGTGTVIRNGGRVMKNVTGYDLVKLLAGSHGTLGVITEVAFKLLPAPEVAGTLCVDVQKDAQAVEAMAAALGSPFDVTGAAFLPGRGVFLRVEGFETSVRYRLSELTKVLARFGAVDEVDGAVWQAVRDVATFHGREGDVWRLAVTPSEAPGLVARAGADAVMYDWGGGLVWVLVAGAVCGPCDAGARGRRSAGLSAGACGPCRAVGGVAGEVRSERGVQSRFDGGGLRWGSC